jgi:hypothetical protein
MTLMPNFLSLELLALKERRFAKGRRGASKTVLIDWNNFSFGHWRQG